MDGTPVTSREGHPGPSGPDPLTGVMHRLKDATAESHRDAERRRLQRSLAGGRVTPGLYARWLGQMYLIHQELWRAIERSRSNLPLLSQVVHDEGRHVANLRSDLGALGVDAVVVAAFPATARAMTAISRTARARPLALLGYNYVLEGSMNGNRFIARALSRTLAMPALSYLDPYGDDQPAVWQSYRERMDASELDAEEVDDIIDAARGMFQAVAEMSDELWAEHNRPVAGLRREAGQEHS